MWSDTDNSFVVSLFVCYICHLSKLISPPSTLLNIHSISHFLIRNGWTSEVKLSLKKWGPYHITWISDWEGNKLKDCKTIKLKMRKNVKTVKLEMRKNVKTAILVFGWFGRNSAQLNFGQIEQKHSLPKLNKNQDISTFIFTFFGINAYIEA